MANKPSKECEQYQCARFRAQSAEHGPAILSISGVALVLFVAYLVFKPTPIYTAEIFILSAALVGVLIGYLKLREPVYSLYLDNEKLSYNHKYGWWQVKASNVDKVGCVEVFSVKHQQMMALDVVGISLKNPDEFLQLLSPRLAGRLLVEQRHFMMQAIKAHCANGGQCKDEWLVEPTDFCSKNGESYTGLLAMFGNRMNHLKQLTGYDVLLSASALDRDISSFQYLLHRWVQDPTLTVERLVMTHHQYEEE